MGHILKSIIWDIGMVDDIVKYCEEDCQITYDLYRVAEAGGLLE